MKRRNLPFLACSGGLESGLEEEKRKGRNRAIGGESKGNVGMAGKKGSRSSADFRCGDSFEAQKGRLTSVADVRSRFDPMAEEAKRASVSVRLRSETRSRATTRTAAREPDAGFLAINVTRLRMDVRMDRGILSPCPSLSLSHSLPTTVHLPDNRSNTMANTDTDDAPLFHSLAVSSRFCNSNTM